MTTIGPNNPTGNIQNQDTSVATTPVTYTETEADKVLKEYFTKKNDDWGLSYDNSAVLKEIERLYDIDTRYNGAPFEKDLKQTWEYVSGKTSMPYGIIAPEDVKPGEKLPVMIFLHGSNEGSIIYERGFGRLANKEGLEGFRGYIICPANNGDSWLGREAQVAQVMDHFTQSHEIDYDNIALAGYSAGAFVIPEYLEKDESEKNKDKDVNAFAPGGRYEISKAAIMAGYNSNAAKRGNIQQEMAVWVGAGDSDSISSMKTNLKRLIKDENYHVVAGAGHGAFSSTAMAQDVDGNGRSDVLEWLFSDEE